MDTDRVSYGNYSGRTQDMEVRTPAFAEGTRVLLVDQWVETGGTMDGATPTGEAPRVARSPDIVAIAMEDNERTANLPQVIPGHNGRLAGIDLAKPMQPAAT